MRCATWEHSATFITTLLKELPQMPGPGASDQQRTSRKTCARTRQPTFTHAHEVFAHRSMSLQRSKLCPSWRSATSAKCESESPSPSILSVRFSGSASSSKMFKPVATQSDSFEVTCATPPRAHSSLHILDMLTKTARCTANVIVTFQLPLEKFLNFHVAPISVLKLQLPPGWPIDSTVGFGRFLDNQFVISIQRQGLDVCLGLLVWMETATSAGPASATQTCAGEPFRRHRLLQRALRPLGQCRDRASLPPVPNHLVSHLDALHTLCHGHSTHVDPQASSSAFHSSVPLPYPHLLSRSAPYLPLEGILIFPPLTATNRSPSTSKTVPPELCRRAITAPHV